MPGSHRLTKGYSRILWGALTALVLTSCDPQPRTQPAPTGTHPAALTIALSELRQGRGNPYGALGPPTIWWALFDPLTRLDADGELAPALARTWAPVDETTWRFQLAPDVRFANGRPFNAAAVVANLAWLTGPQGSSTVVGNELRNVSHAEALDELTVLIHTRGPDPILAKRLTAVFMVEPTAWATRGPQGFADAPVGTGPFRLQRWDLSSNTVVLVRNLASWRHSAIDELHFKGMPERSARLQALLSRSVDMAVIGHENHAELTARGFSVHTAPAMAVTAIALITERDGDSPLQDRRVRQALNYAVDNRAIAQSILGDAALAAGQPASRVTFGYNPKVAPYPYDPARARYLLAQAGFPQGFDLIIDVVINTTPGDNDIYQMTADYLADVGVRTTLRTRLFSSWLKMYLSGAWEGDAFSLAWIAAPFNDVYRPMDYYSCARFKPFFCDPTLMDELARAGREFNPQRRLQLLKQLGAAFHDTAPSIYLVEQDVTWGVSPRIMGFKLINRTFEYESIRIREDAPR